MRMVSGNDLNMEFPAQHACAVIVSTKLVATKCFAKNLKNKKLFAGHPFQLTGPLGPTPPPFAGTLQQTDTWLAATNLQQTDVGHVPYGHKHPSRAASCNQFCGSCSPCVFKWGTWGAGNSPRSGKPPNLLRAVLCAGLKAWVMFPSSPCGLNCTAAIVLICLGNYPVILLRPN